VAGLATSLGSGAMTNTISELGGASAILAIGTNTTATHPIVALQVKDAVRNGSKLIVANPKEIDLCQFADVFLRHKPGTDVPLLMGMMRVIVDEGLHDKSFIKSRCEDFDAFEKSLAEFDLDTVEKITGVPQDKIIQAARIYATEAPASIIYCMGITQHVHGTDNVLATSNLALLTGNIGKPSSGVNPLRGQNNVQGACDVGCLPNVYPGYQAVAIPEIKKKFESAWGVELSDTPGLTHTRIFDACHDGSISALYLVGENPVLSEADAGHATESMKKVDFMVVQDIFMTETAELADVVLPAVTFAEKDGTFTNTERRVQRVRKAIDPVGDAKPDWWIACELAKRLNGKGFDFSGPEEIMEEISSLTPSYQGISYARLEKGSLQWPCPSEDHPGTPSCMLKNSAQTPAKENSGPWNIRNPAK
jgi:formate dehydrogenase alpha subunit